MKRQAKCQSCGSVFEPEPTNDEVQCPVCGALQDPTEGELAMLDSVRPVFPPRARGDSPEAATPAPSAETTIVDQAAPKESSLDEGFFDQATQIGASIPRIVVGTPFRRLLRLFGPALAVTGLFLGWVSYDKLARPPRPTLAERELRTTEQLIGRSVEALDRGDREAAIRLTQEALRTSPESPLVRAFYAYLLRLPARPEP
jgi:hypothetical protein